MKRSKANRNVRMDVRASRITAIGRKRHVEYQIICFYRASDLQKTVTRFEKWRRYSEFSDLDQSLRNEFGYHMEKVKFPPKRRFGNLDPTFIAQRQKLLSEYLQLILQLANVAEFDKHHCSKQLRTFVGYDLHLKPQAGTTNGSTAATSRATSARQPGGGRYQRISRRVRKEPATIHTGTTTTRTITTAVPSSVQLTTTRLHHK